MYAEFYGLRESPFALTPDSKYLFMSEAHQEALASAIYGIRERKGFVLILGEVGTGKTTLIRHLLGQFGPDIRSVFVFNPAVSFLELLQLILRDLEVPCPVLRRVEMIETLNEYLLKEAEAGRYVVLVIDEAQHLSPGVLEEVRMLSNLETARGKLIQIILVGQPELGEKLGRPELRQLRQRIGLLAELRPLGYRDTKRYIAHRLEVAGRTGGPIFTRRAVRLIHRASRGIPRLVNAICDKALVLGYAGGKARVNGRIVRAVLADWRVFRRRPRSARARARASEPRTAGAGAFLRRVAAGAALLAVLWIGLVVAVRQAHQDDLHGRLSGMAARIADLPTGMSALSPRLGELSSRPWRSLRATGHTVVAALEAQAGPPERVPYGAVPAGVAPAAAPTAPSPPGTAEAEIRLPERPPAQGLARAPAPRAPAREVSAAGPVSAHVIVRPGDAFSVLVLRAYGRVDLTLLDFVKAANPDVASIDLLHVGQRLTFPPFEARALVEGTAVSSYRLHLVTVWETESPTYQDLRAAVESAGKRVDLVPVSLTRRETAYRVLAGDFAGRREAEAFYHAFWRTLRAPFAKSSAHQGDQS